MVYSSIFLLYFFLFFFVCEIVDLVWTCWIYYYWLTHSPFICYTMFATCTSIPFIFFWISISVSTVTSRRDTHTRTHTFIRAKEEGDDRREKKLNQNQYLWESDRFWTIPNYQIDNKSQQNVIEFNLATENAQTIRLKVIIANLLMIRCLSFTPIVKWPIK